MKNMANKILIDTNVLLDFVLIREPFSDDANEIIELCLREKIKGCIAAHSIADMYYILRKDMEPHRRRETLINFCRIFEVIDVDKNKLINSLENENFSDFEDCIQMECAKEFGAEYIVTRNIDDYKTSEIPAITPKECLEVLEKMD
jgi:predicted nucleic acid-binding protein